MFDPIPALHGPATSAAPSAPPSKAASGARAFARELERARPRGDAPPPATNPGTKADRHAGPTEEAVRPGLVGAPASQGKAAGSAARGRAETSTQPAAKALADADDAAASDTDTPVARARTSRVSDDATPPDPGSLLASFMVPATLPAAGAGTVPSSVPAPHARGARAAAADGPGKGAWQSATALEGNEARLAASAATVPGAVAAAEARSGSLAEQAPGDDDAEPATAGAGRPAEGAVFALPQATATAQPSPGAGAAAAPAPYAAQIAAPVGSPDFAPGLSAQLSVMVREGLQEARLHLNPAEMGPIAVQIQLDGQQAQVTMVAEQAATRQALEQAMPTLASALREGGLTLTGGGVYEQQPSAGQQEQHRGQAQHAEAAASRRGSGQPGGDAEPIGTWANPATRAGSPRGVLDLYA